LPTFGKLHLKNIHRNKTIHCGGNDIENSASLPPTKRKPNISASQSPNSLNLTTFPRVVKVFIYTLEFLAILRFDNGVRYSLALAFGKLPHGIVIQFTTVVPPLS